MTFVCMLKSSYEEGSLLSQILSPKNVLKKIKQILRICNSMPCKTICESYYQQESSPYDYFSKQASLTVEASIVLPIFILSMACLSSILFVIYSDLKIREAICEEAELIAMITYDEIIDADYIKDKVCSRLGKGICESSYVDYERGGLDFSETDLSNREVGKIIVHYNVKIPYDFSGFLHYRFTECVVFHTWIGYIDGLHGSDLSSDEVYITETGSVYHVKPDCSYLKPSIREVTRMELAKLRNIEGAKYKACERCKDMTELSVIYVTNDGTRFHKTLGCSGLKRTIYTIKISEIGKRKPCSKCSY